MNKAAFLDRDGVINIDKNYLYKISDFELIPGVIEVLHELQNKGFILIIITNQSGIARGLYTEEDFAVLNNWMVKMLRCKGVTITDTYYCPHHPQAIVNEYKSHCLCRKPGIALFLQAAKEHNIDFDQSIAIGDNLRDCEICKFTNCRGFLLSEKTLSTSSSNIQKICSISEILDYV